MNTHRRNPKIEEGRDGRGSRLAPPVPGCECTVQSCTTPDRCTNHCTESCTDHCTGTRITVLGARGGSRHEHDRRGSGIVWPVDGDDRTGHDRASDDVGVARHGGTGRVPG